MACTARRSRHQLESQRFEPQIDSGEHQSARMHGKQFHGSPLERARDVAVLPPARVAAQGETHPQPERCNPAEGPPTTQIIVRRRLTALTVRRLYLADFSVASAAKASFCAAARSVAAIPLFALASAD